MHDSLEILNKIKSGQFDGHVSVIEVRAIFILLYVFVTNKRT